MSYSDLTVLQLKDLLRERGLKVSGRKAELVDRLESVVDYDKNASIKNEKEKPSQTSENDYNDLSNLTVVQLKDLLREKGLMVSGRKAELVARLQASETAHMFRPDDKRITKPAAGSTIFKESTSVFDLKVPTTSVVCVKVKNIRPQYDNLKEWMDDPNNVYIGRAGIVFVTINGHKQRWPKQSSKWANPFKIDKNNTREMVTEKYRAHIIEKIKADPTTYNLEELRGRTLGCWCKPEPCHGDVLLDLVENGLPTSE